MLVLVGLFFGLALVDFVSQPVGLVLRAILLNQPPMSVAKIMLS